jgi:uncharacterized protein YoxC
MLMLLLLANAMAQSVANTEGYGVSSQSFSVLAAVVATMIAAVSLIYTMTKDRKKSVEETIDALRKAYSDLDTKVSGLSASSAVIDVVRRECSDLNAKVNRYEGADVPKRLVRAETQISANSVAVERIETMLKGIADNIARVTKLLDEMRADRHQERQ